MNCKCDKCGAEVCPHCGTVCNESCDKARIDRLEREIEELKARPAQVVQIPIHIPVPSPPTFIPYCPPYIQPPTYYPPWKYSQPIITCEAATITATPNTGTTWISQ